MIYANPAFAKRMGRGVDSLLGKTMRELGQPEHVATLWSKKLQVVLETAQPIEHAFVFATPTGDGLYQSCLVPDLAADGTVAHVLTIDREITSCKKAGQKAAALKERLQATLDSSLYVVQGFEAVRDEQGKIVDFTWVMLNRKGIEQNGDVLGKSLLRRNPGVIETGLFNLFVQVTETGAPIEREQYYRHEQFNGWFHQIVAKMGDGFIMNTKDITEQKKTAHSLQENRELLKATIDSSADMIQVFKAVRNEEGEIVDFVWILNNLASEKVYGDVIGKSLLALNPGVVQEGIFDTFKRVVQTGQSDKSERHYVHEQFKGWYYQSTVKLDDGVATTTTDISKLKKAEKENLQLTLKQQKKLLIAVLGAQEIERRRISESLHNGVAQLLYAAKLQVDDAAKDIPAENVQKLNKLLTEAIHETRRVSHELALFMLKDLGAEQAILEMCRRFECESLRLECQVAKLDLTLEPYQELALYRISQELINNIIRHSKATEAKLLLYQEGELIHLKVRDNGIGMNESSSKHRGIGLRSIKDTVKLLNGTFDIAKSPTGAGTQVTIAIPIEQGKIKCLVPD